MGRYNDPPTAQAEKRSSAAKGMRGVVCHTGSFITVCTVKVLAWAEVCEAAVGKGVAWDSDVAFVGGGKTVNRIHA